MSDSDRAGGEEVSWKAVYERIESVTKGKAAKDTSRMKEILASKATATQ